MVKMHKYYDKDAKCMKYEASIKLGNLGYLVGINRTEEGAIKRLKKYTYDFIKPLINIDYTDIEYIEAQ